MASGVSLVGLRCGVKGSSIVDTEVPDIIL